MKTFSIQFTAYACLHTNQIINMSFPYISINIFTPLHSYNATDSESYLSLIVACLVHDPWSVEDELFNLPLKHVCTQIRL